MFRTTTMAAVAACMLAIAGPASADSNITCTDMPKDQWKSAEEIKAIAEGLGYEVTKVEAKEACYEIYGFDKDKKKVEVYMSGADGSVVEVEFD